MMGRTRRTHQRLWLAFAVAIDVVLFVLELSLDNHERLVGVLLLGPLVACTRAGWRGTLGVGAVAMGLGLALTAIGGAFAEVESYVRIIVIGAGTGVAAWTAWLRESAEGRERDARRLAFLGEADSLLAASLDFRETAERIVALPVPELADSCRFDRRSGDEVVLALYGRRQIVVPLSIRGEPVGALRLEQQPGSRDFDEGDHRLARDLAARCTLALDNAALYEEARAAEEQQRGARARAALLAEASAVFDQSLDEDETLQAVARLSVRALADCCVVVLRHPDGSLRRAAWAGATPGIHSAVTELASRFPVSPHPANPIVVVAEEGESVVRDHTVEGFRFSSVSREHDAAYAALGVRLSFYVALRARGRIRGVIIFSLREVPPPDRREVLLAYFEDVGTRAALAIDNARLYAERSHVARVLQQSLLPPALPDVPGVEIAARYRPAGEGNEVGGDFYDCFEARKGEWATVIGDVCGKGPEAAAVTALARYTIRAAVLHTPSPAAVLAELNEALLRQNLDFRFCTVGFLAVRPRADGRAGVELSIASGGHPLPLVRGAGGDTVEPLGEPGTLLGIVADPELPERTAVLGPGDVVVMYTDGVTEASPLDDALGERQLRDLLGELDASSAGAVVAAVDEAVMRVCGGRPRDDVAVIALRVAGAPPAAFSPSGDRVEAGT